MRALVTLLLIAVSGCATPGYYLEPPAGRRSASARQSDIADCLRAAREPREVTDAEHARVEGKFTSRFFMHGQVVVTPEGKPALHQSLFGPNSSDPFADRYALCLLSRGYAWQLQ